jgi:hypothetical protein
MFITEVGLLACFLACFVQLQYASKLDFKRWHPGKRGGHDHARSSLKQRSSRRHDQVCLPHHSSPSPRPSHHPPNITQILENHNPEAFCSSYLHISLSTTVATATVTSTSLGSTTETTTTSTTTTSNLGTTTVSSTTTQTTSTTETDFTITSACSLNLSIDYCLNFYCTDTETDSTTTTT